MTLVSPARKKIVILGGEASAIALVARLFQVLKDPQVTLIDPSTTVSYLPFWPMIGAGLASVEEAQRPLVDYLPQGVRWLRASAAKIDADEKVVHTDDGGEIAYDALVLATGLTARFDAVAGLQEALGHSGVCSVFDPAQAAKTASLLPSFKGGKILFSHTSPSRFSSASTTFAFLLASFLRSKNPPLSYQATYATSESDFFEIPAFRSTLKGIAERKGFEIKARHLLTQVKAADKLAVFDLLDDQGKKTSSVELPYDLLHVMPPVSPPDAITKSKFASKAKGKKGWLEVDPQTFQAKKYPMVFGLGEILAEPLAKPGLVLRKQVPVVAHNVIAFLKGQGPAMFEKFQGDTFCPIAVKPGQGLIASYTDPETPAAFGPFLLTQEGRLPYFLQRYVLPRLFWQGWLRGWAF